MQIHQYVVGPLQTNCYFLITSKNQTVIIDPGADGDFLSNEILRLKLTPTLIYFTHGHFDHVSGGLPLFLNFKPKTFLHPKDIPLYNHAQISAKYFAQVDSDPTIPPRYLTSNLQKCQDYLTRTLQTVVKLLEVPGHSPGLTALYLPQKHLLFSGDLIFTQGVIGRTDFPYSRPSDMKKSLQKISKLPPQTKVYPGHEATFILADFLKTTSSLQ
jgi:glyoxylase-like metal-dependent hydrolase (beta-lactamase superfamily II)